MWNHGWLEIIRIGDLHYVLLSFFEPARKYFISQIFFGNTILWFEPKTNHGIIIPENNLWFLLINNDIIKTKRSELGVTSEKKTYDLKTFIK